MANAMKNRIPQETNGTYCSEHSRQTYLWVTGSVHGSEKCKQCGKPATSWCVLKKEFLEDEKVNAILNAYTKEDWKAQIKRFTDARQKAIDKGDTELLRKLDLAIQSAKEQMSTMENEVPEDEKEGIKESMRLPAKAKNRTEPLADDSDDEESVDDQELKWALESQGAEPAAIKALITSATDSGYLSNAIAEKLSTPDGWPKPIPIWFITPGLVHYEYMNNGLGATVLVKKPALDKMLPSIVGKPIVNFAHKEVSPADYKNGDADGIVLNEPTFDADKGYYKCMAMIWDEATRENIERNGFKVSCEYRATKFGPGGTHNNVPYDREVLDGVYKHIAVVDTPRYEGVSIMNSQPGGKTMKLFQWMKKGNDEVRNSVDADPETTVIEHNGKQVTLANAVAAFEAQEAARVAAEKAEALKNARKLAAEDTVNINGKEYKVADLQNALDAQVKNASEEKMEKDHKDGDHKEKEMENCPMCNSEDDEEKKKKEKDDDAKNAIVMNSQHALGQHAAIPNAKCAICDAIASDRLQNAAKMRAGKLPNPGVRSIEDGLKRGKELMGMTRAQQEAAAAGK